MEAEKVAELKGFVKECQSNPSIIHSPSLAFFKSYLQRYNSLNLSCFHSITIFINSEAYRLYLRHFGGLFVSSLGARIPPAAPKSVSESTFIASFTLIYLLSKRKATHLETQNYNNSTAIVFVAYD